MFDNTTSTFSDSHDTNTSSSKSNTSNRSVVGSHFSTSPEEPRKLDPGMGVAVARRTVFRPEDQECLEKLLIAFSW